VLPIDTLEQGLDGLLVGDIDLHREGPSSLLDDRASGRLSGGELQVGDDRDRAGLGYGKSDRATQSAPGARDQHDASLKREEVENRHAVPPMGVAP
jgi:hypothetical protein